MRMFALLVLSLLISCGKSGDKKSSGCETMACEVTEFTLDTSEDGNVPPEALFFTTALKLVNFSLSDKEKVENAASLIRQIVMSQEFKDEVINHTYDGKKTFADNNGLTNLQIYNRIIIAAERLSPTKNYVLNAEIQLYYEESSTIGYTYPDTPRIWMNKKYFDRYSSDQVAGNLTHEWLHKLGFTHDSASTSKRPYSVPYAVGYLVRQMAVELY